MIRSAFEKLDVNGDKQISKEELYGILTENEQSFDLVRKSKGFKLQVDQYMKEFDTDKSGKLDM